MKLIYAKPSSNKLIFAALLAVILFFSAWWRWQWLDAFIWNADEGIHLMVARLVIAGYRPYSEVFYSYLPLFLESVRLPLQWTDSVNAVRSVMVGFALLELGAVALLGRELSDNLTGLAAVISLSLTSSFFYYSRAVLADIPAVALGLWASWAALRYGRIGCRRWLVVSGILLASSFLLKLLTVYIMGWVLLLIIQYRWGTSTADWPWHKKVYLVGQDALLFGSSVALAMFGVLVWYDLPSLIPSAFEMRLAMRSAFRETFAQNVSVIPEFWQGNMPLILLAGYGLVGRHRQHGLFWTMLAWLALIIVTLLVQVPLHEQHLQLLLPVLTIMTGLGVGDLLRSLRQAHASGSLRLWLWRGLGVVLLAWYVGYFWQIGNEFAPLRRATTMPLGEDDRMLAEYLQRFTSPNDCLVTDNLILAFFAGRLVPPDLAEVSSARLRSGYLTYDELVSATEAYGCQMVAPVAKRLHRTRHDFVEWAKGRFLGLWLYDGETEVLLAQPIAEPHPVHALQSTFGKQVELVGFDAVQEQAGADKALYLSLYWRAVQPLTTDYTVFVHLRDRNNNTLVNGDHQPYNNLVPTSRWPVGQAVKETVRLNMPLDLPGGEYRVMVGLYSPATLERLPVDGDTSGENAVIIPGIIVP